ncbi:protein containing DUF490 [Pseudovibrio sp. FO-BEG1]|uniref:translocation/assembly module TamB domain-containing protein n=1 Tax=Pseudovibrio sp. (strain FO-BEG1) TaxID=911045 RepID=UPI000238BDC3|nr:translocation/assembly module TamB domain-containing protein [Pseudovibrio sp. FO-BEG1]AEV37096.1 protein containing DUF490 [Pseudovibrio sp. FO-BEG1]
MQLVRRITALFGKLLALLLVLVLVIYAGLVVTTSFSAGRQFLGSTLSSFLPDITIDQPQLTAEGNIYAERVIIEDMKGEWLVVQRASVHWSPLALLVGSLDVQEIAAQQVMLARLPEATETTTEKPPASEETGISLPFSSIEFKQLKISEVTLPAEIAGMPAKFMIDGSAAYSSTPEKVKGQISITRFGEIQGSANLDVDFAPADSIFNFKATVSEAANGLAAHLLDLQGAPSFALRMEGGGPLSDWTSSLQVDLNNARAVEGDVSLTQSGMQKTLTTNLSGELAQFLPATASSLFAGQTSWFATATLNESYLPLSAQAKLSTGTIVLQVENDYSADGGALIAKVQAQTIEGSNRPLQFVTDGQVVGLGSFALNASASGPLENLNWDLFANANQLTTQDVDVDQITLRAKGDRAKISEQLISIPLEADLQVNGSHFAAAQNKVLESFTVSMKGTALPNQQKLELSELHAETAGATARFNLVEVTPSNGQAQGSISISDLGFISSFVQQEFAGSVEAQLAVLADFTKQSGDINLEGTSSRVRLQNESLDRVLVSPSRFAAKLSATLNSNDLLASYGQLETLRFENAFGQIEAHGSLQDRQTEGAFSALIRELELLEPRVRGMLSANGTISGSANAPNVTLQVQSERIEMDGVPLEQLKLSADAKLSETSPNADINLSGRFKGEELAGQFKLVSEDSKLSVPTLEFDLGGNKVSGNAHADDLAQLPLGLVGHFSIAANDLSTLSPLALTEMEGRAQGEIDIQQKDGHTQVEFDLSSEGLRFAESSVGSFMAKGWIDKAFTRPSANASIKLEGVEVEGVALNALTVEATPVEGSTSSAIATGFTIDAAFAENNDNFKSSGVLQAVPNGLQIKVSKLQGLYKGIQANLKQPTTISLLEDRRTVTSFELELGSGSLQVSGTDSTELNITARMNQLPLSLANAFVPSLELDGTLNGEARAFGKVDTPEVSWNLALNDFSAKPLKDNRILPLQITSTGSFAGNEVNQKTAVTNGAGLNLQANGKVGIAGAQNVSLTANGNIPLDVVGAKLIELGFGGSGGFQLNGSVTGSLRDPQIAMEIRPNQLETTQLSTGMTLNDYSGAIHITRQEVIINALGAKFINGGTLKLDGKLGLGEALPAQIDLVIDGGRYVDGTFVSALINADLSLRGSLGDTGSPPAIGGKVVIEQADIEIPSSFSSSINPVIVRHLNAPKPVLAQSKALAQDEGRENPKKGNESSPIEKATLNVDVEAPGKIFIRGRGVNAEAGGSLNIGGTVSNIQTVGAFSLVRGRIDILSKRLTLSRGNVTFSGSLVPFLDFAATTTSGSTEVTVLVSGPANVPVIDFTSVPSLPKDEIVSQLLFGESVNDLSPVELARLASAIATLTGGSGAEGPLGTLRNLLGVSDIDINFDAEGNPELAVGGYINERIYLGVTQEPTTGDNAATVDIDVTKFLKLRGEASSDGDAKAGFYYEREYD